MIDAVRGFAVAVAESDGIRAEITFTEEIASDIAAETSPKMLNHAYLVWEKAALESLKKLVSEIEKRQEEIEKELDNETMA